MGNEPAVSTLKTEVSGTDLLDNIGSVILNGHPGSSNVLLVDGLQLGPEWNGFSIAPLPIELLDFYGEKVNKEVQLKWITTNEINNDFFTIERSTDGEFFEPIGRVEGAGNSNIQIHYESLDRNPRLGINYYRLKQTDFDGTSTFSSIIAIEVGGPIEVNLFPNPSSQFVQISLGKNEPNVTPQIKLFNQLGQSMRVDIENINNENYRLKTAGFPVGVYFVEIIMNNTSITKRLVIN